MQNTKQPVTKVVTKQEYEKALNAWNKAHQQVSKDIAERNAEQIKAGEPFEKRIQKGQEAMAAQEITIKNYCDQNRKELFGEKKSIKTSVATLAYRAGTGKLKLPEGVEVKNLIADFKKKKLDVFIVTKEELDAKAIIDVLELIDETKEQKKLTELGLSVEKGETFSVKPKD